MTFLVIYFIGLWTMMIAVSYLHRNPYVWLLIAGCGGIAGCSVLFMPLVKFEAFTKKEIIRRAILVSILTVAAIVGVPKLLDAVDKSELQQANNCATKSDKPPLTSTGESVLAGKTGACGS